MFVKGERIQMRVQSIGEYYTLQGAAEALGVSYWQVARAVRVRQTPTLLLGQTQLVKLDDLRGAFAADAAEAGASGQREVSAPSAPAAYQAPGHVCPQCGSHALAYEEGCQKCYACGYSAC
jgi:hypothetical protein